MLDQSQIRGLYTAIVTPLSKDGDVDHAALAEHVCWMQVRRVSFLLVVRVSFRRCRAMSAARW
jgi:dihydrodipicolinate synthase/N-acetylneuraminate lyase